MSVLSVDIGIRHLSLCVMRAANREDMTTYELTLWGVHDTLDEDTKLCAALLKGGNVCNRACKYRYQDDELGTFVFCCKTHFPKGVPIEKKHSHRTRIIKDIPLQEIVNSVLTRLTMIRDQNRCVFDNLEHVLIELQPTFNPSMKLISHVVYGKLAEWCMGSPCKIKFVRASQKLRAYVGEPIVCPLKGKYTQRKWLSKEYCSYFLEERFSPEQRSQWLPHFKANGTADEADTFLMCINYLYGLPTTKKKGGVGVVPPQPACTDDKTDFDAELPQKV